MPYTEDAWLRSLLTLCPRDELVAAIAAGAEAASAGGAELEQWTSYVLRVSDPDMAACMRAALADDGGPRTLFLARQPLMLALRLALTEPAPATPGTGDPRLVATMLSHHTVRRSTDPPPARESEPRIGGLPQSLALGLVANSLFNASRDYGDMIARTWLLWTRYETQLVRYPPRVGLRDMLAEATGGLDLEDMLAVAFALFSHARTTGVRSAGPLDLATLGVAAPTIQLFLNSFSDDAAGFAASFGGEPREWAFLPFEARPLLRTGLTEVIVIDERLLQRRFTHALYWLVHDNEKSIHGDQARNRWTQTYSELIELHAEALLRRFAPVLLDGSNSFFTEEDVAGLGGKAADCGIDYGSWVLVADVVQHNFTVETRTLLNPDAFERDIARAVVGKTKQLDGTIQRLLDEPRHRSHPLGRRPDCVVPMVVEGAEFPANPVVLDHVRTEVRKAGLLTQPECKRPLVVTVAELEMLDALVHGGHATSAEAALRGFADGRADSDLTNYLVRAYGAGAAPRSPYMQQSLDDALAAVKRKLHLAP